MHTYAFNIIVSSELLVWNCFRLFTSKFTTISFTMPLKGEVTFTANTIPCTMTVTI